MKKFDLPQDNTAAMELLTSWREEGKKASWTHVNNLMGAIGTGDVTAKNIRAWTRTNLGF